MRVRCGVTFLFSTIATKRFLYIDKAYFLCSNELEERITSNFTNAQVLPGDEYKISPLPKPPRFYLARDHSSSALRRLLCITTLLNTSHRNTSTTTRYAISLIFSHPDHGARPSPDLDPRHANRPGRQRILSFVSDYLSCNLEVRLAKNPYEILTTRVHISKPTDDKGKQLETEKHLKWIHSLSKGTVLLYADGSRSIIGDGAGWVGFHKQDSGLLQIF
jgi:hypothetical protein